MSLRVLVVDDSPVFRRLISDAVTSVGAQVVGTASSGRSALSKAAALMPDLITLDLEMPGMSGFEVMQELAGTRSSAAILVLSAHSVRGGIATIRALQAGAFDFLPKPEGRSESECSAWLIERLNPIVKGVEHRREILRRVQRRSVNRAAEPSLVEPDLWRPHAAGPPVILIAVSTGGPSALARLLPKLQADFGAPVFVVQHMPALFTERLAENLASQCQVPVIEAREGEIAEAGVVYIAPGDRHIELERGSGGRLYTRLTDGPRVNGCRPAADVLFRSAAEKLPGRAVAVILTGMGSDGAAGLRALKGAGCLAIAQDEETCVVFGMPGAAIATGLVDSVLPLDAIGPALVRLVRRSH